MSMEGAAISRAKRIRSRPYSYRLDKGWTLPRIIESCRAIGIKCRHQHARTAIYSSFVGAEKKS